MAHSDAPKGLGSRFRATKARAYDPEKECRSDDLVTDVLTRIIEGDILPRLSLLHRPGDHRRTTRQPTSEEIDRFRAVLLAQDPVDLDAEAAVLLGSDMALDTMLRELLIPAAHYLGTLWEEDLCDFIAVTEGLGRLQVITDLLCARLGVTAPHTNHNILLLPCPGETHLYALSIVANFYRRAGWDVTISDHNKSNALNLVRDIRFDAVGLSLSCDVHLPVFKEMVSALRYASRNSAVALVVGGPWFARHETGADAVGADAYVPDGQAAPRITQALLDAALPGVEGERRAVRNS